LGGGDDIKTGNLGGRDTASVIGRDAETAVLEFESETPSGLGVESSNMMDWDAGPDAKCDCEGNLEYLRGHAFEVILWPTVWHLLHLLGAFVAASTAADLFWTGSIICSSLDSSH
jgi:hypothetical protein